MPVAARGARQRLPLGVLVIAIAMIAVLVSWVAGGSRSERSRTDGLRLPTAEAPPDPGVEPPPLPPGMQGGHPQAQFSSWAKGLSDKLNIPKVALQAYGYAARSVQATHPGCGLSWPLLAGIGAVETNHGCFAGGRLDDAGISTVPIRGLPLNGHNGVKRIRDTDSGRLDGDPAFDRAIGPMQFIPSTWRTWAVDADGDGVANPDDINDASLAAATYLCTVGGDLRQPNQFWATLAEYNDDRDYGQDVLDHADHYGRISRSDTETR